MLDPSLSTGSQSYPTETSFPAVRLPRDNPADEPDASNVPGPVRNGGAIDAADANLRLLSATVELQIQLDGCLDLPEAAGKAAGIIGECLSAGRVLLAWRSDPGGRYRFVVDTNAVGGEEPKGDPLAEAAAEEVATRSVVTVWPPTDSNDRHALLAVAQFAKSISASSIVATPLSDPASSATGVVISVSTVSGQTFCETTISARRFLDVISVPLASKLSSLSRLQGGRAQRLVGTIVAGARSMRRRIVIGAIAATTLLMLLPVRYTVRADCELQPVERRFVAAPFDGPLLKVGVRPGDTVRKGDLLATINAREIGYELAAVRADLHRAIQEKKGKIAEHDFAAGKIASLETQRLQQHAGLLEYRQENLEIRSPIDGVVVSGDLKHVEGAPVTKGEELFEIAPLGKMIVEVAIPEREWAYVEAEMPVRVELHALPRQRLRGQIDRIHPRAELRDQDNVFIGEVLVDDPDAVLRPGMRGRSWVKGDRYPLGWNLFHRAYLTTRSFVRSTFGW